MSFPGYKLSINDDHLHSAANIRARAIVDAGIVCNMCLLTEFTVKCFIFIIIYLYSCLDFYLCICKCLF